EISRIGLSRSCSRMPSIAPAAASPPPTITYGNFMAGSLSRRWRRTRHGRGLALELVAETALPGAARRPGHDDQAAHQTRPGDDPGDAQRADAPRRRPQRERNAQQREAGEDPRDRPRVARAEDRLRDH